MSPPLVRRPMTASGLMGLLVEVASLRELAAWEPVGSKIQSITDAAQQVGPWPTQAQVNELRWWADSWKRVSPALRSFYVGLVTRDPPDDVAWRVLRSRVLGGGPYPAGPDIGHLKRCWEAAHAREYQGDIAPHVPRALR